MYAVLLLPLTMAFLVGTSDAIWCVCRSEMGDAAMQKTLDYACGAGADCVPIQPGGGCYEPNTVRSHCSYAVNSYFQRKLQVPGSCDFAGTAAPTAADPSYSPCPYPSVASSSVLPGVVPSTTPVSTTPVVDVFPPPSLPPPPPPPLQGIILPPPSVTPITTIPNTFTPTIPTGGVIGFGPPTGIGTSPDGTATATATPTSLFLQTSWVLHVLLLVGVQI